MGKIEDLQAEYSKLINRTLPAVATKKNLPVHLNHCFGRIILDEVCKGCWYETLDFRSKVPAYKQLTIQQLSRAVVIAKLILHRPADYCIALNNQSLTWRKLGKTIHQFNFEEIMECAAQEKSNTPEYAIWSGLRTRCNNSKRKGSKNYMERGITYDPAWDSYDIFLADMGLRPNPNDTIDRINVNGNYCKENCRWASRKVQANNKTNNDLITYEGKTLTLCEWADEIGMNTNTLRERIRGRNWDVERALTTPVPASNRGNSAQRYSYLGKMQTLREISNLTGVNLVTLRSRLRKGKTLEQAAINQ